MSNSKSKGRISTEYRGPKAKCDRAIPPNTWVRGSPSPLCHAGSQSARGLAHYWTRRGLVSLCFLFSTFCFFGVAQFIIPWHTVDGGGSTSTSGVYTVSGTIGQPDAGSMFGGQFTLVGGFWSVVAAVQTPGAPYLTVLLTATNTVVVSWPGPAVGWVLEVTNALPSVSVPWPQIPPPYQTNGPYLQFIESVPLGTKFYRLHKP